MPPVMVPLSTSALISAWMRRASFTSGLVAATPSNGARQPSMSCLSSGLLQLPELDQARAGIGERIVDRIAVLGGWMLR